MTRVRLRNFWRATAGSAATEFAFLVPILILFVGGIVEFGQIFRVYNSAGRLASQVANVWADCSDNPAGTCQTEMNSYATSATRSNIAPQLISANTTMQLFQVQMSGTSATVTYSYPAASTLSATQLALAQARFGTTGSGVIVSVTYSHSLVFFGTLMTPYLGSYLTPTYTTAQLRS